MGEREYREYCGFRLSVGNPGLAAEWHPTKNGKLTLFGVSVMGAEKVMWAGGRLLLRAGRHTAVAVRDAVGSESDTRNHSVFDLAAWISIRIPSWISS